MITIHIEPNWSKIRIIPTEVVERHKRIYNIREDKQIEDAITVEPESERMNRPVTLQDILDSYI